VTLLNQPAPDFSLPDQDDVVRSLSDYAGKWVVLYFYPMDDTPGCTTEACTFRDERDAIADLSGAEVIGISKDSVASHKAFVEKHHLNFTLLSNTDHAVIEAYQSWKPTGTERNTFIISPDGLVAKEYLGVDPKTHAAQIITDLKALQN